MSTSSHGYATPLALEIRTSPALRFVTQALHLTALVALVLTALPSDIRLGLALVAVAHLVWMEMRLRKADGHALRVDMAGEWSLRTRAGDWQVVVPLPSSRLLPGLVVLDLRLTDRRRAWRTVIARDTVTSGDFRRLRARLLDGVTAGRGSAQTCRERPYPVRERPGAGTSTVSCGGRDAS